MRSLNTWLMRLEIDNTGGGYIIVKRIYYNLKNLSRSERDMIVHIIDIIEELHSERNDIYAFLEAERKRDMSNNTERFRCGYVACLNNLKEFLNKRNSYSGEKTNDRQ